MFDHRHFPRGIGSCSSHATPHNIALFKRLLLQSRSISALTLLLLLGILLQPTVLSAAPPPPTPATQVEATIQQLQQEFPGAVTIRRHTTLGTVRLVQLVPSDGLTASSLIDAQPQPTTSAMAEKTDQFLRAYGALFGLEPAVTSLVLIDESRDSYGYRRLVYQEQYQGIPIFGGQLNSHFTAAGQLTAVNGVTVSADQLAKNAINVQPSLTADNATAIALSHVRKQLAADNIRRAATTTELAGAAATLYIYQTGMVQGIPGPLHLAYYITVQSESHAIREFVVVDAHTGLILDQFTGIHSLEREVSEGSIHNVVWDEGDGHSDPIPNGWNGGSTNQVKAWNDEITGAKEAYNFFGSITNGARLSYDGADAIMRTVNNDPAIQCPNAIWDGVSANYCNGITADDIVVHEWAHAYTEYTSNLIYAWQSGALNESFSDIWGETADLINGRGTDVQGVRMTGACSTYTNSAGTDNSTRWLAGEDATGFAIPGYDRAIRDMWNPTCYENPGKVSDSEYSCTTLDSGGVHLNSGVPNHLYALLVDGGTYNGRTVNAIGLTRAAHLFWRTQQAYLTMTSDFVDLADGLTAACNDLIGQPLYKLSTAGPSTWGVAPETISATHCNALATAIDAVELRQPPSQCSFQPILQPNAPALCSNPQQAVTIALQNWEDGLGTWQVGRDRLAVPADFNIPNWSVVGNLPDGRAGNAAFGPDPLRNGDTVTCKTNIQSGVIYLQSPQLTIPAYATQLRLAFEHWVAIETGYDGGIVQYRINNGAWSQVPSNRFLFNGYNSMLTTSDNSNPLAGLPAFTGTDEGSAGGSWGQSQIDFTGLVAPGNLLQLRFDLGLDACSGHLGWYVDDILTYTCADPNDLAIRQQMSATSVLPGQAFTIQILVDNDGQAPTANVTVNHALPATLSYVNTTQEGPITFNQISGEPNLAWHIDQLLGTLTSALNVTVKVHSDLNQDQRIVNRTTINADNDATADNNVAESAIDLIVPRLGFAQGNYQVEEGETLPLLLVADQPNPYADMVVNYTVISGSASAGADFTTSSGELRVTSTMTTVQLLIPTLDDSDRENDETFQVKLSTPRGAQLSTSTANIAIIDNDRPGVSITPLVGFTTEDGKSMTVDFVLKTAPAASVVIAATSSDVSEGTVSGTITFTPENWDTVQRLTITGVDDAIDDGDLAYTVDLAITSTDSEYAALVLPALNVINRDNDFAALTLHVAIDAPVPSVGTVVTYTYRITNSGNVDISELTGSDSLFGSLALTPTMLLPGNDTAVILTRTTVISDLVGANPQTTTVSARSVGGNLIGVSATPTVNLLDARFHLTATVGILGIGDPCTGSQTLQVPLQTKVVRCYAIQNSGAITLTPHTVIDSQRGALMDQIAYPLAPGASFAFTSTEPATSASISTIQWLAGVDYAPPVGGTPIDELLTVQRSTVVTVTVSSAEDDLDGDTIPDNVEGAGDPDGDLIPNYLDIDADGDNLLDKDEVGDDPTHPRDSNGNGTPDYLEVGRGFVELWLPVIRR